jgi:hypothetical protein
LLSHGKVYNYNGKRTKDELVNFAKTGYKTAKSEPVPEPVGFLDDIFYVFKTIYKDAMKDINAGRYFTNDTVILTLPILLILAIVIVLLLTPAHQYDSPKSRKKND